MRAHRRWRLTALSLPALLFCAASLGETKNPPLSTARLLVDLAKDTSLSRPEQTPADLLHISTLLRAAARLDPSLPDAHRWLYELATLQGDLAGATSALNKLVKADATNRCAFEQWLNLSLSNAQTSEDRTDWLNRTLEGGNFPPAFQSVIHLRLAGIALESLDRDRCRMQLDRALAEDSDNPEAARLRLQLLSDKTPPHVRVIAALNVLRTNPVSVDSAWYLAALLDSFGFGSEAARFYQHALAVFRLSDPGQSIPPERLLDLSHNEVTCGDLGQAEAHAREAVAAAPNLLSAQIHLHWLLSKQGKLDEAQTLARQLHARFSQIKDPTTAPIDEVAQAAWFYCSVELQPRQALMLAESASKQSANDRFVSRVLGWAQVLNQRTAEAVATLTPLAASDPYAAYQLARIAQDAGDATGTRRVVDALKTLPSAGQAYDLLASLGNLFPTSQPSARRFPEIADVLSEFDGDILDFHKDPGRFVSAEIALENPSLSPGEPWWATFTLTNQSTFPITLGAGWMLNPVFLLSFEMEGDRNRSFPDLFTVAIDHARVVKPGESVRLRETIDLGPLRRISRQTPQQLQRITLTAILDPQRSPDGVWSPSLTGQRLKRVVFNRLPVRGGSAGVQALFAAINAEQETERYGAIEVLAELLGERQRADLKKLPYDPSGVPDSRISQSLMAGVQSDDWQIRVRTLDALQLIGFDQRLLDTVRRGLKHEHWLVRLMTLRLLGEREGRALSATAKVVAEQDKDALVRDLANSYLSRWSAPSTSQPSEAPAGPRSAGGSSAPP